MTNALTEGIYEWTLATNQLAVSQRLAALVGFEQSEAQNLLWAERVHPDDMARYRAALVGHFRRQTARLECEYRLRIKSDEYRWFQDYGIGIRDDSGRVVRLLGAIRDIHERKKTEEALRLSEERYALAMEAVNESVFDWDLERKEVTYSTRFHAATLMGVGDEEVRDPQNWYRRIHPDDVPGYKTSLADHFKGNTPRWDCTYRYRAGDGSWRWARQHGMALRDSEGRAWRMIGAIGDVTGQAETEQALEQARGRLIQAEKMASLGRLTAGIAHEIKNPLNFVNNFAVLSVELLDELKQVSAPVVEALDDAARVEIDETIQMLTGNLEKIAEHGRRADNIVKSMLEHSRGVSGERREVDINALADEALKLAFHGARAQDQTFNITIERDFGPGLRAIELVPQDITRVFLNLFSNGFYAATRRQRDGGELEFGRY